MVNPHLPQEILLQIFSKLPAKSVVKCRALSKSWNTELSTSHFIKNHLISRKQTIQQENLALSFNRPHQEKMIIVTSPTKEDELLRGIIITHPRKTMICQFNIVGSCDGLVLLDNLFLFNPITLKNVWIPPSTKYHQDLVWYDSVFGFGYDSFSDDYKIVQISSATPKGMITTTLVDVYSVKNRVWKRVLNDYPDGEFLTSNHRSGAFVNGALHWLVAGIGDRRCIAAFDLGNEVFRDIALPEGFVRQLQADVYFDSSRSTEISVVGGCLLIVDNHGNGTADIWILREYGVEESWVKFFIRSGRGDLKWKSVVALCYVQEGELLCLTDTSSGRFLYAFDLKEGTGRRVVLRGHDNARFASGIAFIDSLIPPK